MAHGNMWKIVVQCSPIEYGQSTLIAIDSYQQTTYLQNILMQKHPLLFYVDSVNYSF